MVALPLTGESCLMFSQFQDTLTAATALGVARPLIPVLAVRARHPYAVISEDKRDLTTPYSDSEKHSVNFSNPEV